MPAIALPRKGIPKYHAKFMPVATCVMNYEPIVTVNQEVANAPAPDGLTLDEKIEFVQVRQWGRVAVLAMGVRFASCGGKIWDMFFRN